MTGRTHDLAAFTSLVIAIAYVPQVPHMNLATAVVAFGMNFVGGLFPDIDQPTSDFWDNFRLGPYVAKIICPIFGGHRNISHSLVGIVVIGTLMDIVLYFVSKIILLNLDTEVIWWSFMIGYLSHLVIDLFTKDGLPILWPVQWKFGIPPIKGWRITTGKLLEKILIFPGLVAITAYVMYTHQDKFWALIHQYVR